VLDDRRLGWADFSVPGLDETLRVNGRAQLVTDPELCARFAIDGKPVRVVVVVTVDEAYIHCAKALRRAELWSPESWLDADELPSAACIVKDHARIDADLAVIQQARDTDLQTTLWQPGGSPTPT
jgi:hypothetical protein